MADCNYKISLITPVYNAIAYIEEAFESVKNQTIGFENVEWLLVDDCSTDGSYELLCEWAETYPNLKVLRTPSNTGTPAGPRNIGLDNATAPYVMFLDNDDAFFPNAMKALYDEIERTGVDVVAGDVALMNPEDFPKEERHKLLNGITGISYGFREMQLPLGEWAWPYRNDHWCKIYKRDIIEQNNIRCLSGALWEDILFLFQYMTCAKTMIHIEVPILNYRARRESLSHVHNKDFYCSLPKSIDYGFAKVEQLGERNAQIYAAFLVCGNHVEHYMNELLDSEHLSQEELSDCLMAWKNTFIKSVEYDAEFHSAYCKIIADDFACGDDEKALFHFFTLKELYKQRQLEVNNILNSRTFRLAKKIADIKQFLGGKKEGK